MSARKRRWIPPWIKQHIISVVVFFLIACWAGISWLVYRAEHQIQNANITSFGEGLWWGIVTFLTVGYGDRYPITPIGRVYAGFLMLAGVTVVGIVTAKISSYFLEHALQKERGVVDTERLHDHFIVCGWKEEMHQILGHILDFNHGLTAAKLVLVANLQPKIADALRDQPRLKGLKIIIGDYYEEASLKRAAPERARKVLILADRTPQPNGLAPSVTEVDARTVMTAMTLSHIARGTTVAAEILDIKMGHYLKLASVNEIIYSREYSRLLLGNASGGTGITNIIFDLLDPGTPTVIVTEPIPEEFVGIKYAEYKAKAEARDHGTVLIGVLENTGNSHSLKEFALRKAQKTSDVNKLVENLRSVKAMKFNHPVFNPSVGYVIPEGAMAIVVKTRPPVGEAHV